MTQPSGWANDLLKTRRQALAEENFRAELRARDERMFQSKAPESWQAIVDKLKADCGLLADLCQISDIPLGQTMGQPAVRLQGNGSPIRIVTARFDINGHFIKVVRSHIRNAVDVFDSKELIEMKLTGNDEIVFLVEDLKFYTVEQVSGHLTESIIRPRD